MVRLLLKHGADPILDKFEDESMPLQQAISNGDVDILKAILDDWAG